MSEQPDSRYAVPGSARSNPPQLGFWARLLRLPFSPALWSRSADREFLDVALPLLLLALIANLLLGWEMVPRLTAQAYEAASYYEANADPLVYEDGRLYLDGERILHQVEDDTTILVDPERTLADEVVTTPQYLIVRSDEVTLKQSGQAREVYEVEDFVEVIGPGPLVLDGETIRELADRWVAPVIMLFMSTLGTLGEFVSCLFYALIAGALILLLRGRWLALGFASCYRVALATSAAKIVLMLVFGIVQFQTGVPGIVQWPVMMTMLGLAALRDHAHSA